MEDSLKAFAAEVGFKCWISITNEKRRKAMVEWLEKNK